MRQRIVVKALPRVVVLAVLIILVNFHVFQRHSVGLRVKIATDTCGSDERLSRTIVLHVAENGELSINLDPVKLSELAMRLSEIYSTRNERVLYFSGDDNVPFQRIVDAIDTVPHSKAPEFPMAIPEPPELRRPEPDSLDIEIRLITPGAVNAPCRNDYYNWGKQGLPIVP